MESTTISKVTGRATDPHSTSDRIIERNVLEDVDRLNKQGRTGNSSSIIVTDKSLNIYNSEDDDDDDSFSSLRESECLKTSNEIDENSDDIVNTKETKHLRQAKFAILLVVFFSLCGALSVFIYTRNSERKKFEQKFEYDAFKVFETIGKTMERSLGSLDSLSRTFVSIASASNQTFPFVTIRDFGIHASKSLLLTGGLIVNLVPVVTYEQRQQWEQYASSENHYLGEWIFEALNFQETWSRFQGPMPQNYTYDAINVLHGDFGDIPYNVSRPDHLDLYLPLWQAFPLVLTPLYAPANYDWYDMQYPEQLTKMITQRKVVMTEPKLIPRPDNPLALEEAALWCEFYKDYIEQEENCMEPLSMWYYPVLDTVEQIEIPQLAGYPSEYPVKAVIAVEFYWRKLIRDILPPNSNGVILVFENSCVSETFTYRIDGPTATYAGVGDKHDPKYDYISKHSSMFDLQSYRVGISDYSGLPIDTETCFMTFHVYPSDKMKANFMTWTPYVFALSAIVFIVFPFLIFLIYERIVEDQKKRITVNAKQSKAIISSLYPANVRDKLFPRGADITSVHSYAPIADLYTDTTVLFADIASFTAWSSARDAYQVFILLERIYGAFDEIVARRRVFKVETIGDSYIAVAGLPEPRKNHAEVMAKVAKDMITQMVVTTMDLDSSLGPGTSALRIRVGLNSGPTTAGVLRGTKSRFQLFGDTVNTAARMESNSLPGRILCSQKTADLLIAAGKEHWINSHPTLIDVKGKGKVQCYWCKPNSAAGSVKSLEQSISPSDPNDNSVIQQDVNKSNTQELLVNWMVELFDSVLKEVDANRMELKKDEKVNPCSTLANFGSVMDNINHNSTVIRTGAPRDEVSEIIAFPKFVNKRVSRIEVTEKELCTDVKEQLYAYISSIATMYRNNPFHNFEHAGHVVLATKKLLSRVIRMDETTTACGIASDPLTQFAIFFSALIHDLDHPGVSNSQLVKERAIIATKYENKSVAEQNSITLAWELLMQTRFRELRTTIMATEEEQRRFRRLIVNSVMATDLFDTDLRSLRENRWTKAFDGSEIISDDDSNRRATIVIEHIIQASDVSHTMQHWQIYQKWNRHLFVEMYTAYVHGRAEKDPSEGWYNGELWFFDNYIIPLAKKLKTCGVFGVSCDEFLDYATDNRAEWAAKGKDIVAQNLIDIKNELFNIKERTGEKS